MAKICRKFSGRTFDESLFCGIFNDRTFVKETKKRFVV